MNKAELEAEIAAKAYAVVQTVQEPDAVKEAAGVTMYMTNVMERTGDNRLQGRNIGWYVVDEGGPAEAAFYRDTVQVANDKYQAELTFLKNRGLWETIQVVQRSENHDWLIARCLKIVDGVSTPPVGEIVHVMAYYNDQGQPQYCELQNFSG